MLDCRSVSLAVESGVTAARDGNAISGNSRLRSDGVSPGLRYVLLLHASTKLNSLDLPVTFFLSFLMAFEHEVTGVRLARINRKKISLVSFLDVYRFSPLRILFFKRSRHDRTYESGTMACGLFSLRYSHCVLRKPRRSYARPVS